MAISLVARLHRQANGLRAEVNQLRLDLAQAKMDFSETMGSRLSTANEQLVIAVLHAEAATETAVSDLGELALTSDREALLRCAIDSAQIGEWDMDLDTGVMRHSLRHDMCFGHQERQPAWNTRILLQRVHPEDRPEFEQTLRQATHDLTDWQIVCRVLWPDTSVHWISIRGGIFNDGDRPARLMGVITEITKVKLAEVAQQKLTLLEQENRQMLETDQLKNLFMSHMTHELRTPLNAIIGFTDLLHMRAVPVDSPKQQQFLGHIGNSARHLLHLINDVLDLSKVEAGKFPFHPEPVDLRQLIAELGGVLHSAFERHGISFEVDVGTDLPEIVIDPMRLKQVLYNYLSNALKFTPAGGRVMVRALPEGGGMFRLEVEDTGLGIAAADLPRLFVDFQQLDAGPTKLHQGTGIGLALTRRLVQAQGGSVGVRSVPGQGSVFHAVLPLIHQAAP